MSKKLKSFIGSNAPTCSACGAMHPNGACMVCCPDWLYIGEPALIREGAMMQGCSFCEAGRQVVVVESTKRVRGQSVNGFQRNTHSIWMIVEHEGKTGGIWFEDLDFYLPNA